MKGTGEAAGKLEFRVQSSGYRILMRESQIRLLPHPAAVFSCDCGV